MNKLLLAVLLFFIYSTLSAQQIFDGEPRDSTVVHFDLSDTNNSKRIDTTGCNLWQTGNSHKPYFGNNTGIAIMTDTALPYPVNANDWFTIKFGARTLNNIISFSHKYQTEKGKAGGIVEYSQDGGVSWNNIVGYCSDIFTQDFYSKNDTLENGTPAFTGISNGWIYSRFQFFDYMPARTTGAGCRPDSIFLRFRFVSDSSINTNNYGGWLIDSIKLEQDYYTAINKVNKEVLKVYPNPSYDDVINFPFIPDEKIYYMHVTNAIGTEVWKGSYTHRLHLANKPAGLYLYRISNGTQIYTGHFVLE